MTACRPVVGHGRPTVAEGDLAAMHIVVDLAMDFFLANSHGIVDARG